MVYIKYWQINKAMSKLKTLDEFNKSREGYIRSNYGMRKRNGIKCPQCEEELFDTHPNIILSSLPPQKSIHCATCGWQGYRLA